MFLAAWSLLWCITGCGGSKGEFTIWVGGAPQEVDFWEDLIRQFRRESATDLRLVRQPTYSDQRRQMLLISLDAHQPNPDVFLMDVVWIRQFSASGWLEPLDAYVAEEGLSLDVFFPHILNNVDRYDDALYALPVFMDAGLLYRRTDLLEEHGSAQSPATWEDLVTAAAPIVKEKAGRSPPFSGFVWQGAQYEGLVCTFLEFAASRGGGFMENGRIRVDRPENVEALGFMRDLIHRDGLSPKNTYTEMREEEVRRAFQSGNALFERNWSYAWNLHNAPGSPVRGRVGMAVLPHGRGHRSASALGGWHIGISRFSDRKAASWDFIRFVTSYAVQEEMVRAIGWNPGRKDIYRDRRLLDDLPHLATLEAALDCAVARPTVPYYPQVSDVIQRFVNSCLAGKMEPAEALRRAQADIDRLTALYEERPDDSPGP